MPIVGVEPCAFHLQTDPPIEHEGREAFPRFATKRLRRIQAVADLGRVDPEKSHGSNADDVDRVAVDDRPHQYRIGSTHASG
jgi:hypothetical protein